VCEGITAVLVRVCVSLCVCVSQSLRHSSVVPLGLQWGRPGQCVCACVCVPVPVCVS
jgi:hypothetical protein